MMKKAKTILVSAMPVVVIGALLYVGIFIKPNAVPASVEPPVLGARDVFYGAVSPEPSVIWAVGRHAKIVRSDDGGDTWLDQQAPVDANLQSIAAWSAGQAIAVGQDATVLLTTDAGKQWVSSSGIPEESDHHKLIRIRTAGEGRAYVVGEYGQILLSTDYGESWQSLGRDEDIAWNDIAISGQDLVVVGEFGKIRRSDDGGQTWLNVDTPASASLLGVAFDGDKNAVAVGLEGAILVSNDRGATWRTVKSGTQEHLFTVLKVPGGWAATGDRGLLLQADASANQWSSQQILDGDYSWYTDIQSSSSGLLLAGASLVLIGRDHSVEKFK